MLTTYLYFWKFYEYFPCESRLLLDYSCKIQDGISFLCWALKKCYNNLLVNAIACKDITKERHQRPLPQHFSFFRIISLVFRNSHVPVPPPPHCILSIDTRDLILVPQPCQWVHSWDHSCRQTSLLWNNMNFISDITDNRCDYSG